MAKNIKQLARKLGAKHVAKVSETGGGAFGAARLAGFLHARLQPSQGERPGRPTDPAWVVHRRIPMTRKTAQRLTKLAEELSTPNRKISPMQVAAQLLEEGLENFRQ